MSDTDEPKKFSKDWHRVNPEYNRNKRKEFIARNPDYDKQKILCDVCQLEYSRSNASHHRKTYHHLRCLNDLANSED